MSRTSPVLRSTSRTLTLALSLMALVASLVVTASPAGAATVCVVADDDSIVIQLDEASPEDQTVVEMRDGVVFVNDEECGSTTVAITIIDVASEGKVDRVQLNLAAGPFRAEGEAVFVQILLDDNGPGGARDEVTIRGTKNIEQVQVLPGFMSVSRAVTYPGSDNGFRLSMGTVNADAKYYFQLRAGNDTFQMIEQEGEWFEGFLSVKGGPGADIFVAGPKRQRLRGGSGPDVITALGGNDLVKGGSGADYLSGGSGRDEIVGGTGIDTIRAGGGDDTIDARDGAIDDVYGASGNDTCDCNANDIVGSIETLL